MNLQNYTRLREMASLAKRLRRAIDLNCKSCIFDPKDHGAGSWKRQVENCTCRSCALWEVRPGQYIDSDANSVDVVEGGNDQKPMEQGVPGRGVQGRCPEQAENRLPGPANGLSSHVLTAGEVAHG